MSDDTEQLIAEFRANRGRLSGRHATTRLLLLTTTGAKTGTRRTTPLRYVPDGARKLIVAAGHGAPNHPAWYHNIRAHSRVTVEDGAFTYEAEAVVLDDAERDRLFAQAVESEREWAAEQAKTDRTFPMIALYLRGGGPEAGSFGDHLRVVHGAFRRELAVLRREIAESGTGLAPQLRVNCLALCHGLHHHHTLEDRQMFPFLDAQHPELDAVLARLRREHRTVERLLDQLQELVSADGADSADVLNGVERLTSELEAHLDYEEEQLVPVLNGLTHE